MILIFVGKRKSHFSKPNDAVKRNSRDVKHF
jgi:hypothetical protein